MDERTDSMSGATESTDAIRRDIERTQREMGRTIDEIQYRLSPDYLKERTKQSIRSAGMRTSRGFMDKVRDNPLGAAMVGVGLYLMMRNNDRDDAYEYERDRSRAPYDTAGAAYGMYDAPRIYSPQAEYRDLEYGSEPAGEGRMGRMRERAGHAAGEARERVAAAMDSAREGASEAMHAARETTSEFMDDAATRAHYLRERARFRAMAASRQGRDFITDTPLIAGVAAIALGAVIGAMVPETDRENEWFGEASDNVTSRAKSVAREGVSRAKDVATHAAAAAVEVARDESKDAAADLSESARSGQIR